MKVLQNLRQISSNFIISGGICDLHYLNTSIDGNQDIAIHLFDKNLLYSAIDMFDLFHYMSNEIMEIYPSKSDIIVVYFHFENKLNNTELRTETIDGFDYKFFSKSMRKSELDLKLHMKYNQPAINNIDVKDILKYLVLYSKHN